MELLPGLVTVLVMLVVLVEATQSGASGSALGREDGMADSGLFVALGAGVTRRFDGILLALADTRACSVADALAGVFVFVARFFFSLLVRLLDLLGRLCLLVFGIWEGGRGGSIGFGRTSGDSLLDTDGFLVVHLHASGKTLQLVVLIGQLVLIVWVRHTVVLVSLGEGGHDRAELTRGRSESLGGQLAEIARFHGCGLDSSAGHGHGGLGFARPHLVRAGRLQPGGLAVAGLDPRQASHIHGSTNGQHLPGSAIVVSLLGEKRHALARRHLERGHVVVTVDDHRSSDIASLSLEAARGENLCQALTALLVELSLGDCVVKRLDVGFEHDIVWRRPSARLGLGCEERNQDKHHGTHSKCTH
jgi:hypothetical protein